MDSNNPLPTMNPRKSEQRKPPGADSAAALAERLRTAGGTEDDIAMMVAVNWQKVVGALIVVLIGVWIYGEWKSTTQKKAGEAAERFEQLRNAYTALLTPPPAQEAAEDNAPENKREAAVNTLNERIKFLENSYDESLYAKLAPLYRAAAGLNSGDVSAAKELAKQYKIAQPPAAPVVGAKNLKAADFVSDLASLIYARALLLEGEQSAEEFRRYTSSLALNARFVNIEALLLLYRAAQDDTQRAEAKNVAEKVAAARPELAENIRQEFGTMGVKIE